MSRREYLDVRDLRGGDLPQAVADLVWNGDFLAGHDGPRLRSAGEDSRHFDSRHPAPQLQVPAVAGPRNQALYLSQSVGTAAVNIAARLPFTSIAKNSIPRGQANLSTNQSEFHWHLERLDIRHI